MKKLYFLAFTVGLITNINANTITIATAKTVSENFYIQNCNIIPTAITLAFTETSLIGEPVYYAFNINAQDGFVIVSADDDAHPIIGYSTKGSFITPAGKTNFAYWMNMRKNEIIGMRDGHFKANTEISNEWNAYINNVPLNNNSRSGNTVAQLCTTTWDQSPYYNAMCPGTGNNQAVTGCVATAMAQIMKFWGYPSQGVGSSSYCDCTSGGFTDQNGTLSANYGATTYSWSSMPLNVTSANTQVAKLMYQCGVSVEMDYDPNGSGAFVTTYDAGGSGACAQFSYVRYFKYDSTIIQGYQKSSYSTDAAWVTLLENELNTGRPIQYAGDDATNNNGGGHTWVCDGYDANNKFHMNWGWSGQSDGFFPVTNLTTGTGTNAFNPILNQEVLMGIRPLTNTTTGINNIDMQQLSVYPNPANANIIIETSQTGESFLVIYNISGQELLKQQIKNNKTQIDISTLSEGIYFVKLFNNNNVIIKKLVKE